MDVYVYTYMYIYIYTYTTKCVIHTFATFSDTSPELRTMILFNMSSLFLDGENFSELCDRETDSSGTFREEARIENDVWKWTFKI